MFKPLIEFCLSNLASGAYEAKEILEQDEELDVIDYGCLSYCGQCGEALFALVNGEVIRGEDSQNLVKNIYQYLAANPI
ncbi:DUF1450 domain-containing protein [Niallia sp.]|uniref:DUF1450 domain-containing protein n=1 Tax=Niallia sp. TaxID=2837523 RepID=UPI00289CE547|nr:DUF1450 domain-containing protein [Niallia sp.]